MSLEPVKNGGNRVRGQAVRRRAPCLTAIREPQLGQFPSDGGRALNRIEGIAKLTGREPYVDDLAVDGCLWGMTVRSPSPRGRIREIRFDTSIDWSKFVVVDHRDLPGPNEVKHIETDQPVLAHKYVRHVHEPIVLLAHSSRRELRPAVPAVTLNVL